MIYIKKLRIIIIIILNNIFIIFEKKYSIQYKEIIFQKSYLKYKKIAF